MEIQNFDDYCFVCGKLNPRGLHIQVHYQEEARLAETELVLPREYQGWPDVVHGGLLATLLDELMAHAVWRFAGPGVTLNLEVSYKKPLKPGEAFRVWGAVEESTNRRLKAHGEVIRLADSALIARGSSRFLLPSGSLPQIP